MSSQAISGEGLEVTRQPLITHHPSLITRLRGPGALAGAAICLVFIALALAAPLIEPHDPYQQSLLVALQPPSPQYWLGTDEHGRDILSRILAGAQVSLFMSLTIVALALLV